MVGFLLYMRIIAKRRKDRSTPPVKTTESMALLFRNSEWSFLSLEIGRENQNNYQSKVGGSYLKVRSVEAVEILRNLYPFCLKHTIVQVDNFPEQRQIDLGNQIKFSKFH